MSHPQPERIWEVPPEKLVQLHALQRLAAARRLQESAQYVADPHAWAQKRLGAFLWSGQRKIATSVADHRRTVVHSANAQGKSWLAATLACWWIDVHPPGDAFVVTTAGGFNQVRAVMWRYINRAHKRGGLPGRVNQTEWWINDEMVGIGRKPADYDPDAFQGIHARYVLVVLDECSAVPRNLWDAAGSLAANEESRILAIGNPTDPASHFAEVCKPGSGWNVIHLDGLESPNFTDEEVPDELARELLAPIYAEEQRAWGEDSAVYMVRVRGLFPIDAEDGVIRASKLAQCMAPDQFHQPKDLLPVELGVDPAAGGDMGVIRERRGVKAGRVWRDQSQDTTILEGKIIAAIHETGATKVKIDEGGLGLPIKNHLMEKRREGIHDAEIVGVNFGAKARTKRYPKLRHELWFEVGRNLTEEGWWDLSECDDDTISQLLAPKWTLDSAGRTVVEPKEDTKKRIGRSPDDVDALLLAFLERGGSAGSSADQLTSSVIPMR